MTVKCSMWSWILFWPGEQVAVKDILDNWEHLHRGSEWDNDIILMLIFQILITLRLYKWMFLLSGIYTGVFRSNRPYLKLPHHWFQKIHIGVEIEWMIKQIHLARWALDVMLYVGKLNSKKQTNKYSEI